jgi:hypothetical protein
MSLYLKLDIFPEVRGTRPAIKIVGFKTAILSNGSPHCHVSPPLSITPGIGTLLDYVLGQKRLGSTRRIRKSISLLSAGWGRSQRRSVFNHRMHGMPMRPLPSACA